MQAVVRKDRKGNEIELVTMDLPKPKAGQVLVKVHASPINPSDFGFMKGAFGNEALQPKPPVVIGFEGSGHVVSVGEGVPSGLIDKPVCFFGNCHSPDFIGSWANFTIKPVGELEVVSEKVDLDTASMVQVNPRTVMGFWHMISTEGHKAVIQSAAASAVGKMLIKLCMAKNVESINIVRGKENVDTLYGIGAKYVLDSQSADFAKSLEALIAKVNPTIFFDAVGGALAGTVFTAMPATSQMQLYGSLEMPEIIGIKGTDIRFKDKTIKGYQMTRLFAGLAPELRKSYLDFIWKDLEEGGKIFKTNVAAKYELKDWKEALQAYPKMASKGKILLVPKINP